jgi:hypothetical protein
MTGALAILDRDAIRTVNEDPKNPARCAFYVDQLVPKPGKSRFHHLLHCLPRLPCQSKRNSLVCASIHSL